MAGSRYILLKGSAYLGQAGRRMLAELLSLNENLFKAYLLKEEFRQLYRLGDGELSEEQRYRDEAYFILKIYQKSGLIQSTTKNHDEPKKEKHKELLN